MSIELKQAAQQVVDAFDVFSDADDFLSLFALTQKMRALRTAIQQAEAQQPATGEPVYWEWRHLSTHPDTVDFGKWSEWKRVEARSPIFTAEDELRTLRRYIADGYKYELRALYTHPAPSVFLVRDVASLLGASVPDVCNALAELGYEPRRSTNAAISPDEAIAVAKRINPAPSVPADVVRDAERFRRLNLTEEAIAAVDSMLAANTTTPQQPKEPS